MLLLDFFWASDRPFTCPCTPWKRTTWGLLQIEMGILVSALGPLDQSVDYDSTRLELQETIRLLNSDSAWTISFWFETPWSNPSPPPSPHFYGFFLQGEASIYSDVSGFPSSASSSIGAAYTSWNGSDIYFNGWEDIEWPFSGTEFNQESVFNQFPLELLESFGRGQRNLSAEVLPNGTGSHAQRS